MSRQLDESNARPQHASATKMQNLYWAPRPWLAKLGASLVSFAGGIAVNDFSGMSGYLDSQEHSRSAEWW